MSNFYSSAAQILPPKSPVYALRGSQTDLQAATTEEEEEEEPSGDCAGPCLHSKILYLGATIHTHRPAVSIGLEICSCQRTPEKKYRKQQLAAKGISFCCCSRSFVKAEWDFFFIFHFTFLAFEEKRHGLPDALESDGPSRLPSFASVIITRIFGRATRPKDSGWVPSDAPGYRCSQCDRVIFFFYRHYHYHQNFYASFLLEMLLPRSSECELHCVTSRMEDLLNAARVPHVSYCTFPSGAVGTIHLQCDKNKARGQGDFTHTHLAFTNTHTHRLQTKP